MTVIDAAPVDEASEPAEPAPVRRTQWWRTRSARIWTVVVLVFALLVGLQAIGSSSGSRAYDPDSTRPGGTKAFVMLMQRADAKVERSNYPVGRTAVLFQDTLNAAETGAVQRWVEMGGTLIVGDPLSSFQQGSFNADVVVTPDRVQPHCQATFINGVDDVSPAARGGYQVFKSDLEADAQCFSVGKSGYWLQQRKVSRGQIIEIGGSQIFTNDRLDKDDNSVLLTNILKPSSTNPLTILETKDTSGAAGGPAHTDDPETLLPLAVRTAFFMVLWGAVLWIIWQARRLGRPIDEDPLVRIPASQLVVATGDLMELAQQTRAAAQTMSMDLRRTLSKRFGMRADVDLNVLIETVSTRTGVDESQLRAAFQPDAVISPESLVAYSQRLERLQQEVMHVR